jgi:hypothetical protein
MKKEDGYYREMEELHCIREELQREPSKALSNKDKKRRIRN